MFYGVDLSLYDDHQFIDVSRYEEYSWSKGRWWLRCIAVWAGSRFLGFSVRAMAHVLSGHWALF